MRGNPLLLPSKGFSVVVWIRPVIDPEAMFSNIFTLTERTNSAALNVTASGSLQFMLSDGEKQLFEAVTEREKLVFNRWNLVSLVCSQKYSKKDDFVLYLNGNIAESGEIRPSKFPKDMYSTLFIGGNSSGDSFSGQISPFYLFSAPATDHQISLFYHFGPDYEGFLQSEEINSGRVREIDRLSDLKAALSLCVTPRYTNLKGRLLDGSPTGQSGFDLTDAGRTKKTGLRRPPRTFEITNVQRIQANRTPDTVNLYGGPALLFPLLYRVKDKQQVMELLSEIFYMTADLFLIPSHMTVKHVCREGLCEFIRMALEELAVKVEVDPGLVRCVIRMVDNLEWNREARHKAFFTLLHSFRFWSRLDWDLQKDIISHTYRILPLIRSDSDPSILSSALSLLRTYFSTARPIVDRDQLPVKREYIWTIVNNQITKQGAMNDTDIEVVIENLLFTYSYSRDDLPDIVRFTRFLLEKATLKLSDDTKEEFNKAVMFLLRKCGLKKLTGLQADLLNAVREFYLAGKGLLAPVSMIQKQIHRVMSFGGENASGFRFKSESSLFEVLNCMLPKTLTSPVYSALLRILLGGSHMDNLPLAQIKYPQVLDLITNRLSSSLCAAEVYQQLMLLTEQHVEMMYKRDAFPAWLLHLFIYSPAPDEPSDQERSDLLFSLCATLFTKAFLHLRNPGSQLRLFVFTFAARIEDVEWRLGTIYRVLGDVLNGLESGMSLGHAANIKKDVYYNLHDFAYLLEDLCEHKSTLQFPSDASYPSLIHRLLELCKKVKLSMSSYPPFPVITTSQTLDILLGAPQFSSDSGDCVRLREGGMMRALITLILRGIASSSSELPTLLLNDLTFLLNGGSQTVSLSAFSAANKITCEMILQDDSTFRYLSVFSNVVTEPTGDLLYSEQFLTLYVFTYCMEAMYERTEKGLDCTVLGAVVRELTKKYKLGQFLNAVMERETPESMREVQEFHRRHPQLFSSLISTNTRVNSVFTRLEAFVLESSDDTIELKNLQSQVRKLTLDLNKASGGGVEGVLNIVLSEEWRERVHSYLVVQTLAKMLTLSKAVSGYLQAGEVHFNVLEPHPDLMTRLMGELQQWKKDVFQRIHQKEKAKDRGETLERLFTKRRWRKYVKTLTTPKTGLWALDAPEGLFDCCFLRLVNRFDRENRHFLFQLDSSGSSHNEAINRKHLREIEQTSLSLKRKTITSIDPEDPEQREMLKSFPSLKADTEDSKDGGSIRTESGNVELIMSEIGGETVPEGEENKGGKGEEDKSEERKTEVDEIPEQETVGEQTPVYTYPSTFQQPSTSLLLDAERICLKGAIFGKLELTPQFLMFKSTVKELKPQGVYFGSALECSQIGVESELVWDVREIVEVFSRRFHHLHTAIEIFMLSGKGYYFNLFSEPKRTEALQHFKRFTKIRVYIDPKKEFRLGSFTKDWQKGVLSNYEYLMVLNKFASRSYNDLNQYPVFPWILKDYTSPVLNLSNPDVFRDLSIPIGAIHPDGLRECTRRYALWTDDPIMKPFHFGSHYSSEGIVLHYLLRIEPYASKAIQLQDGTFDVADRLFFSISSAYEGSTKSSGDVKELIPEFFYLPEMFINMNSYELGKRQTGESVSNVELPAWAKSPYDFIRQHRKALESLYISDNLHNWIDLVFGYKQWGEAAVAANNVFFCFTYEQHVVPLLKSTADTASMEGVIQQIGQFGQTPVQLFDWKHEKRQITPCISTFFDRIQRGFEGTIEVTPYGSLLDTESDTKVVAIFALRSRFLIVQDNLVLKIVKWRQGSAENNRPEPSRSQGEVEQALENAFPYSGDFPRSNAAYALVWPYLISGLHWDNSFKLHEFETGKMLVSMVHHLGLVTCLAYNQGVLVSGSLDSTLAVWELRSTKSQKLLIDPSPHLTLLGHSSGLKQCHVSSSQRLVLSLSLDSILIFHSLYDGTALHRIDPGPDFTANIVALSSLSVVACCSREQKSVRVYSCNGKLMGESGKNEAFVNAKQMFFSAAGECVTVMSNTAICIMDVYAMGEETEIALEHVPAAITLTLEDQNIVGISHAGSFFRIDAESKRTKLDLRNIYDPQGFKAFNLDI